MGAISAVAKLVVNLVG